MNKNLEVIKNKYLKKILSAEFDDDEKLEELTKLIIPGAYENSIRFSDVDYESQEDNNWPTIGHLTRLRDLAVIYARGKAGNKSELEKLILAAVNEWTESDPVSFSWWQNDINAPGVMTDIALIVWDMLDDEQKFWVDLCMSRGSLRYNYNARMWTGANQLWGTDISAKHAIVKDDEEYLSEIAARMYSEVVVGGKEGIQKDWSYFQHGPLTFSGGYGKNFVSSIAEMLNLFDGTPFELPPEKVNILTSFILDGTRWMIHKGYFDYNVCGREFTRPGWGEAGCVAGAGEAFCKLHAFTEKEGLLEFKKKVDEEKVAVEGVKYFPIAAMMCTHIDDCYIGYNGINSTTWTSEQCADENVLCANMTYGTTTCVLRSGKEYLKMAPLWNYSRIPGTTSRSETDEELITHWKDCFNFQTGDRFGGAQLDDCAVIAQTVKHNGISTTTVAFGTPYGVVILGSGIRSENKGEELITTVEQCLCTGEPEISDMAVTHNGIKYINLDPNTSFVASVETRRGSWKRNNLKMDDLYVEERVLEITLQRGGDRYAYLIQPETKDGVFEVIANTEDFEAVRIPDGRILAHFFSDGEYTFSPDGDMIRGKKGDSILIQ